MVQITHVYRSLDTAWLVARLYASLMSEVNDKYINGMVKIPLMAVLMPDATVNDSLLGDSARGFFGCGKYQGENWTKYCIGREFCHFIAKDQGEWGSVHDCRKKRRHCVRRLLHATD